jgi:hypothetical protein
MLTDFKMLARGGARLEGCCTVDAGLKNHHNSDGSVYKLYYDPSAEKGIGVPNSAVIRRLEKKG